MYDFLIAAAEISATVILHSVTALIVAVMAGLIWQAIKEFFL